jgi:glycosyltransferase involved in cell wall biosynthesis
MLLGGRQSGVETAVEGLCRGLCDVAGPHQILVAHRPGFDGLALRCAGVVPRAAPWWSQSRPGRILYEHLALPEVCRQWGADVLHGPGYVLPAGWRGPSVVTVYDALAVTHPEWCKPANALHLRRALAASVRRAGRVVVPSEVVREEVVEALRAPAERVRVVPLGISHEMTPAGEWAVAVVRRAHDLPERYLLWVGNLEPKKNLPDTLRAFELAARHIPHDLVLAGARGWRCEPILAALNASPVAGRIRWLGYVPESHLAGLYSGAELLVHWSLYEGAGLTPLEAMACGTPAVVSDGGALPELAGQVAPVVPLGDPADLAEVVVALAQDREQRADLARRGLEYVKQFTWQEHARKVVALYEEVAGGET